VGADPPALVEVTRSGVVESRHRASVVGLDAAGTVVLQAGDVDAAMFPRSANKPLQAVGMVGLGLPLDGELLALACASHSGEPFHVQGVRRILATAGLTEAALQTPADWPLDAEAARDVVRGGGDRRPVFMNCSGKHAAMLATCVVNGWDPATYRDPEHPLQRALRGAVEDLAGEKSPAVGVDGCGAPLFALTLAGLAQAFAAVAIADPGTPEHRVAEAVRRNPRHVGGTSRDVTRLLAAVPGLVAKDGAEGVYAAALPDGRAVALKVEDGSARARPPLLVAALGRLGVDAPALADIAYTPVLGHGEPVGEVCARL
jgi:L-asparaginase II